jgi:hypothetical protein
MTFKTHGALTIATDEAKRGTGNAMFRNRLF